MSDLTPGPDHAGAPEPADWSAYDYKVEESPSAGFLATSRKALVAGATAALPVAGTGIAAALADGVVSQGDIFGVLGAVIGAFALAFGAVYQTPNAKR